MGHFFFIPAGSSESVFTMVVNVFDQFDGAAWGNITGADGMITPDPELYPTMPSAATDGSASAEPETGNWYVDYLTLSTAGMIRNTLTVSGGVDDEFLPYSAFNGDYEYVGEVIVNNFEGEPEPGDGRTITRTYRKVA